LRLCPIDEFPNQYKALDRVTDSLDVYGYGSDYITDKMIQGLKVEGGFLVTESGVRYKALHVPVKNYMPEATTTKLATLKEQGAKIIEITRDEATINAACAPEPMRRQLGLRFIRRANPTGYHYFISNLTAGDIACYTALSVNFQSAAIFNPLDGSIRQALVNDEGKVYINLHSGESIILQTYDTDISSSGLPLDKEETDITVTDIPLKGSWTLAFNNALLADGTTFTNSYVLDKLKTWESLDANTAQLMGTGSYETTITLTEDQIKTADRFELDLGDVRESAKVYINDEYIGTAWSVPFRLDCGKTLKAGSNTIRIEVTNLPANRIRQLDKNGTVWRIFDDINFSVISSAEGTTKDSFATWNLVPSGLNSTVTLRALSSVSTGIENIVTQSESNVTEENWYTIQGVRIERPTTPGIYINGAGQKVIIR
jgi:hypothetical protein